jgi:hypothetical protein
MLVAEKALDERAARMDAGLGRGAPQQHTHRRVGDAQLVGDSLLR